MPRSFFALNDLRQHKAKYKPVFNGLRISMEGWASPTTRYDRSQGEYVIVVSGRADEGSVLYRRRPATEKVGDGVMLRFPDDARPVHVVKALYGDDRCEWEVIEMHRLCMQLTDLEVSSPEAVAIYNALEVPSKTIIDAVRAHARREVV